MAEQDSQRGGFWTSLPGILTGAAALITAVSGLAIWHHQTSPQPAPAPIVQQAAPQPAEVPAVRQTAESRQEAGPPVPTESRDWCEAKYQAWKDAKTKSGVDDALLRKQLTRAHCPQYGFILGPPK